MYQIKHSPFIESGIERMKACQDATSSASTLTQSLTHLYTDYLSHSLSLSLSLSHTHTHKHTHCQSTTATHPHQVTHSYHPTYTAHPLTAQCSDEKPLTDRM